MNTPGGQAKAPASHVWWIDEGGQDLIEYALVLALIALAVTVSMSSVATAISAGFTHVSSRIANYTT